MRLIRKYLLWHLEARNFDTSHHIPLCFSPSRTKNVSGAYCSWQWLSFFLFSMFSCIVQWYRGNSLDNLTLNCASWRITSTNLSMARRVMELSTVGPLGSTFIGNQNGEDYPRPTSAKSVLGNQLNCNICCKEQRHWDQNCSGKNGLTSRLSDASGDDIPKIQSPKKDPDHLPNERNFHVPKTLSYIHFNQFFF